MMEEEKEEATNNYNLEQNKNQNLNHPTKEETGFRSKGFGSGDRVKRDEWSEGAVSTLLEAYEAKWVLRNRAKLKGHDWEDVARHVSARANSTKSPKTSTQCKNKVESMKKRYRSESATAEHPSSWPLYSRLDLLLRGTGPLLSSPPPPPPPLTGVLAVPPSSAEPPQQSPPSEPLAVVQNSHGSNGVDHKLVKEDVLAEKCCEDVSRKNPLETDSSTPAVYSNKKEKRKKKVNDEKRRGRRRKEYMEIAESLRWLAEAMIRSEEGRMETMKEIERMRVEAEAKRGEMDLKRTEIIANTQLEIARIFATVNNKPLDSSLRIGRS
ncbi:trihelix transcription factor ASIL1-like [Vigna radiata var. radiata]|uniref:Trihelix transcription factor ASIL1-like n=1 Tax=Vigna radiata var. radiata TaxID=3916 RepID=A0A1S3VWS9_VIGRR|nr:trihelix transcription factor ASIL1-like [Vigna radiata var. radiata]